MSMIQKQSLKVGAQPLVSVIVPVYKVEKYIHHCIDSLLKQTYTNLEIILIDDGSPDCSGAICDEYAKLDSRIKVIHQKNAGVSTARNTGLDICSGEYITFVDSDDYIVNDMIDHLVQRIDDTDYVCCGYTHVDQEGRFLDKFQIDKEITLSGIDVLNYYYGFAPWLRGINCVAVWGKLYKRELWRDLRLPPKLLCEDVFLMPYILLNCKKIRFIPFLGYNYRQVPTSITNNFSMEQSRSVYIDSFYTWDQHLSLYKKHNMFDFINAVECLKIEKIIAHTIADKMPHDLKACSKKTLRKSVRYLLKQNIGKAKKFRYTLFMVFGKVPYKFFLKNTKKLKELR